MTTCKKKLQNTMDIMKMVVAEKIEVNGGIYEITMIF